MTNKPATVKSILSQDSIKNKFKTMLGRKSDGFTANLAIMVSNNYSLAKCDPMSIISAAVISASLDLPLDPNLGFAAIVPYGTKAQFQMMYKGFVQLAMRTGQYKTIGVTEIYKGQLKSENPLTGKYDFDFNSKESDEIIGYAAYFELINGFEKTVYWNTAKITAHGQKFSKSFNSKDGRWKLDFPAMAKKTVLKHIISKWGIMSIELQKAVVTDQGVVTDITEDAEVEYPDNDQREIPEKTAEELVEEAKAKKEALKNKQGTGSGGKLNMV